LTNKPNKKTIEALERADILNEETIAALEAAERGEGTIISGCGRVYIDKEYGILISSCYYCQVGDPDHPGIPPEHKKDSDIK
jgi:hypothetical protein